MRWIFLVPFVVLSSFCFGQVPDYVYSDSLLLWSSLAGNVVDESGNGNNGELENVVYTEDDGLDVAYFNGQQSQIRFGDVEGISGEMLSISLYFNSTHVDLGSSAYGYIPIFSKWYSGPYGGEYNSILSVISEAHFRTYIHPEELQGDCENFNNSTSTVQGGEWIHLVYTFNEGEVSIFHNGQLFYSWTIECIQNIADSDTDLLLGGWYSDFNDNYASFEGLMRDFGVWNRILSEEEIQSLYLELPIEYGCLDSLACNYNEEATVDDDSCDFASCLCLQGTIWNDSLGGCIPDPSICNEGTYWDHETQSCMPINSCPEDLNYDGIIGVEDLLTLLSSFGTPCDPPVAEWTCGDPVSYHGYDYETVLIGEQCWFAENLRTELYQNGDSIENNLAEAEWEDAMIGAVAVYGEGESNCTSYTPDYEACDEEWSLSEYGRLYNGYTVQDARNLCPVGWHVPADWEWTDMTDFLGGASTAADNLKATYGWLGGENGANSSGFNALPGGVRNVNGEFDSSGSWGNWWSSSLDGNGDSAWYRGIHCCYPYVQRNDTGFTNGISVRCLKD